MFCCFKIDVCNCNVRVTTVTVRVTTVTVRVTTVTVDLVTELVVKISSVSLRAMVHSPSARGGDCEEICTRESTTLLPWLPYCCYHGNRVHFKFCFLFSTGEELIPQS